MSILEGKYGHSAKLLDQFYSFDAVVSLCLPLIGVTLYGALQGWVDFSASTFIETML